MNNNTVQVDDAVSATVMDHHSDRSGITGRECKSPVAIDKVLVNFTDNKRQEQAQQGFDDEEKVMNTICISQIQRSPEFQKEQSCATEMV